MTTDEILDKLEQAFKAEALAKVDRKMLQLRLDLLQKQHRNQPDRPELPNKIGQFIEQNAEHLTQDDLQLLEKAERTPAEIEEILGHPSEKEIRKRLLNGIYRPGRNDSPGRGGKRMVCTISVVEYLIYGETKAE